MHRRRALVACLLVFTAGCTSSGPRTAPSSSTSSPAPTTTTPTSSATSHSSGSHHTTPPPPPVTAAAILARMSEAERVGQLLMVDCPAAGISAATTQAIRGYHVGSVILDGTNYSGRAAIAQLTGSLEAANPSPAKLFIATDQEGGTVQRLQGPGFSRIPSAVSQGKEAPGALRADAKVWARELRAAGVNVDLAPVLDTVPAGAANPPIGDLSREYGSTPAAVAAHGIAVAEGLADGGVVATVKHFPGLGRVAGNTDLTAGVRDDVTSAHDPYLQPFAEAVADGVPFVMVSTAIYTRIDASQPAIFSPTIVTGILRDRFGFRGVIITDDVGNAAQVAQWSPGQRAVKFIEAGGDIVLTVDAGQAAEMTQALLSRAQRDPAFRRLVDAAALRVLQAKQRHGLLG